MEKSNNLVNTQRRGGMLETLVLTLAPLLAWLLTKCALCTAIVVAYLLIVRFILNRKATLKAELTKAGKGFVTVLTIVCALFIFLHTCVLNAKNVDTHKEPETVETQPEEQKEEEVKADDKTEETSNATEGDSNARRTKNGTLDKHGKYTNPDGTLKDAITVKTEANNPNKAPAKAETTTGSTKNTIVDNAKADEKTEELIEEAKKDDTKKVEDCKSDIVVITTPAKEDKKVEETKSVDPAKDIKVNESKFLLTKTKLEKLLFQKYLKKTTKSLKWIKMSWQDYSKMLRKKKSLKKLLLKLKNQKLKLKKM